MLNLGRLKVVRSLKLLEMVPQVYMRVTVMWNALSSWSLNVSPEKNHLWLTVKELGMRVLRLCSYWFEDEKLSRTRSRVGPKHTRTNMMIRWH